MDTPDAPVDMYEATHWRQWYTAFGITIMRGIGQVVFMNDARSGLIILLALFIQSPFVGLCAFLATACGTATGFAFSFPPQRLHDGFYGYNACLVGAAIATFSPLMRWTAFAWMANSIIPDSSFAGPVKPLAVPEPGSLLFMTLVTVAAFGSISTLVQESLINTVNRIFKLPTFTFAFNFTTIVYFLAAFSFKHIPTDNSAIVPNPAMAGPPDFLSGNQYMDGWRFLQGSFIGVGQVFFCSHWVSSVLILIGIYVASHTLAVVALVSSVGGAVVGMSVGANTKEIVFGLWGYNSVLAGMAVYVLLNISSVRLQLSMAAVGVFASGVLFSAFRSFTSFWGVPVFTFPFCVTGLLVIALRPMLEAPVKGSRKKLAKAKAREGKPVDAVPNEAAEGEQESQSFWCCPPFNRFFLHGDAQSGSIPVQIKHPLSVRKNPFYQFNSPSASSLKSDQNRSGDVEMSPYETSSQPFTNNPFYQFNLSSLESNSKHGDIELSGSRAAKRNGSNKSGSNPLQKLRQTFSKKPAFSFDGPIDDGDVDNNENALPMQPAPENKSGGFKFSTIGKMLRQAFSKKPAHSFGDSPVNDEESQPSSDIQMSAVKNRNSRGPVNSPVSSVEKKSSTPHGNDEPIIAQRSTIGSKIRNMFSSKRAFYFDDNENAATPTGEVQLSSMDSRSQPSRYDSERTDEEMPQRNVGPKQKSSIGSKLMGAFSKKPAFYFADEDNNEEASQPSRSSKGSSQVGDSDDIVVTKTTFGSRIRQAFTKKKPAFHFADDDADANAEVDPHTSMDTQESNDSPTDDAPAEQMNFHKTSIGGQFRKAFSSKPAYFFSDDDAPQLPKDVAKADANNQDIVVQKSTFGHKVRKFFGRNRQAAYSLSDDDGLGGDFDDANEREVELATSDAPVFSQYDRATQRAVSAGKSRGDQSRILDDDSEPQMVDIPLTDNVKAAAPRQADGNSEQWKTAPKSTSAMAKLASLGSKVRQAIGGSSKYDEFDPNVPTGDSIVVQRTSIGNVVRNAFNVQPAYSFGDDNNDSNAVESSQPNAATEASQPATNQKSSFGGAIRQAFSSKPAYSFGDEDSSITPSEIVADLPAAPSNVSVKIDFKNEPRSSIGTSIRQALGVKPNFYFADSAAPNESPVDSEVPALNDNPLFRHDSQQNDEFNNEQLGGMPVASKASVADQLVSAGNKIRRAVANNPIVHQFDMAVHQAVALISQNRDDSAHQLLSDGNDDIPIDHDAQISPAVKTAVASAGSIPVQRSSSVFGKTPAFYFDDGESGDQSSQAPAPAAPTIDLRREAAPRSKTPPQPFDRVAQSASSSGRNGGSPTMSHDSESPQFPRDRLPSFSVEVNCNPFVDPYANNEDAAPVRSNPFLQQSSPSTEVWSTVQSDSMQRLADDDEDPISIALQNNPLFQQQGFDFKY